MISSIDGLQQKVFQEAGNFAYISVLDGVSDVVISSQGALPRNKNQFSILEEVNNDCTNDWQGEDQILSLGPSNINQSLP